MFGTKKSNVFRFSSLLSLILLCAFAATIFINYSGLELDYATQYDESEYQVQYVNNTEITGDNPVPIKACFVFDSSGSGWNAVVKGNLLDYIRKAFHRFEDQSHIIEFDGYAHTDGSRSTGAFLPIESDGNSKLWRAIDKFEASYKEPWGDMPYSELIYNGIDSLSATDDVGEKVLIFIIGSPNTGKISDKELSSLRNQLDENNIHLYVLGLANKSNNYDILQKLSDNVYKEIAVSDVEPIVTEIFEEIAYHELSSADLDEAIISINKPVENETILSSTIRLFSTEPFECSVEKLTTLNDGRESVTSVTSLSCDDNMATLDISDVAIEEASESLKYRLSFERSVDSQKVYYEYDYEKADVVLPAPKIVKMSLFEWLDTTYQIDSFTIAVVGCALFALLFMIPLVVRIIIKEKAKKYATACESRG